MSVARMSDFATRTMYNTVFKPGETVWIGALEHVTHGYHIDPFTGRLEETYVTGTTEVAAPGYRRLPYTFSDDPSDTIDPPRLTEALWPHTQRGIGLYHDETGGECMFVWE